jgi:hypothetical protein
MIVSANQFPITTREKKERKGEKGKKRGQATF